MVMSRRFSRPGFPDESSHQPASTAAPATVVRRIAARPTRDLDGSRGAAAAARADFLVLLDIYEKELYPEHSRAEQSTAHHEVTMKHEGHEAPLVNHVSSCPLVLFVSS